MGSLFALPLLVLPGAVIRAEAERFVIRSRAGDQHATATIDLFGQAVRQGTATKRQTKAYQAIADYIERHPVGVKDDVGAEAADVLRELCATRNPATLGRLPAVGGPIALGIAAVLLCGPLQGPGLLEQIADPGARALIVDPQAGIPETDAEAVAQWVGRILREASLLQHLQAGDVSLDPLMAWELGQIQESDDAPIDTKGAFT